MAQPKPVQQDKTTLLLEKLLAVRLFELGATQEKIAKTVGRQKLWVTALVKGIPKKGSSDEKPRTGRKKRL